MLRSGLLVAMGLVIGAPVYAQEKASGIDEIFSWVTSDMPGCAVAVSEHGELVLNRAYGLADVERDVPITPNTMFDASSLVKQFVAASILLLVDEGRLSLSEDVRKYVPQLQDYEHKITLDHLMTHTSGIRDYAGILALSDGEPDILDLILRQRGLDFAPGEEWAYSNSGYVLLKEIVSRTSGVTFAEFARTRLFKPLGMESSAYVPDVREVPGPVAIAYKKGDIGWQQDILVGSARGGGALLSTATDLLIWDSALANSRLGAFVSEKIQEPATLGNGRKLDYARGLYLNTNRGGDFVWHTGGGGGYRSILARYPNQELSIAIMCNAGEGADRVAYARRIFDLFVPPTVWENTAEVRSPAPSSAGAGASVADMSGRAGLYFNEHTGQSLRLIASESRVGIAGVGPLVAVAPDRFRNVRGSVSVMSGAEFELQFLSENKFEIKSREGETTRYRRAQPYAPTAGELNEFAGRYENDEAGSLLEILADDEGLVMRSYRTPEKAGHFEPVDRDTFMLSMMTLHFVRDETGKVVGYDYSNPVVRNIRFTRVSDDPSGG